LTKKTLDILSEEIEITDLIENSVDFIEKNENLVNVSYWTQY
jgi:hypothetical protein